MVDPVVVPDLAASVAQVVRTLIGESRPRLVEAALTGDRGESDNVRHADNFLSVHDMAMHRRYRELLQERLPRFVYASEEADPVVVGDDPEPDLCVLVDPLDTSELAVRGLLGYTHVLVYSRRLRRPVAAVVGDLYHHVQLYLAARTADGEDRAWVITADGQTHQVGRPRHKPLAEALVTNFLMRPAERFQPLAAQTGLLTALAAPDAGGKRRGRIGVDFGSVSLCHVATGFTDATVEFVKGFAVWDLAPGHYVLHAAGGTVLDLAGEPISLDYGFDTLADITAAMGRRQKFVAAASAELAGEILAALTP